MSNLVAQLDNRCSALQRGRIRDRTCTSSMSCAPHTKSVENASCWHLTCPKDEIPTLNGIFSTCELSRATKFLNSQALHSQATFSFFKMSTTTMQFGPEWMRTKPLARSQLSPSPPPSNTIPASGLSSYSALVSATPPAATESSDEVHPFRYSKDELLRIYQDGGGKGGLGLEVERWEGVVRDASAEPVALREMTEAEKKVCCLLYYVAMCAYKKLAVCRAFEFRTPSPCKSIRGIYFTVDYLRP